MERFSTLLVLCAGNSPVTGEFPTQRPVTRSFDVFFDLRLNIRLSKPSWDWWLETPSCSLWRHCSDICLSSHNTTTTTSQPPRPPPPISSINELVPVWPINITWNNDNIFEIRLRTTTFGDSLNNKTHFALKKIIFSAVQQHLVLVPTYLYVDSLTLRPRQNGRHYSDDIFQCIFVHENCCTDLDKSSWTVFAVAQTNV